MMTDLRQSLELLSREARAKGYSEEKSTSIQLRIFREFVERERERLHYEHRAGASGHHVVQQWTAVVDAVVIEAYRAVMLNGEGTPGECALIALGGYGRGALNICSDVDLLFLFAGEVPEQSPIVHGVLHLLWDVGFDLGHSARSLQSALEFASRDDIAQTAVVDARFLAGLEPLFGRFVSSFRARFMADGGWEFSEKVVRQLHARREAHGSYAQVLEPDVKESTGGLRDVHALQWIASARHGTASLEALVEHHLISKRDFRLLEQSIDLLWKVRNELHFVNKRKHDRLDFTAQPKVAAAFGYRDDAAALGVEHFMRDYYLAAREIVRISDAACHQALRRRRGIQTVTDIVRRRVLPDGAVYVRGKILLPKRRKGFFATNPRRMLSLFADMQRFGAIMSETASWAIYDELALVDEDFRTDPENAAVFLSILSEPAHLGAVLRRMHWTGLLGAFIPEFGRLTCQVQHDYYHAYTADEHSIIVIDRLSELALTDDDSRVATVYRSLSRKHLLHLAALLHDVGKSGGHGHAERGAEMSITITRRLGLEKADQDLVAFLVAHHLRLSHLSQRRDIDDLAMIRAEAERFSDTDTLDMLYVLTWADMNATQARPLSRWKCQLLDTLHQRLREVVETRGLGPEFAALRTLESPQKFRNLLAERIGEEAAERHLSGMPRRYSLMHSLDEAATHALRADSLKNEPVLVDVAPAGNHARVIVYTRDRRYLLSDICGVLAVNNLNILYADAYTRTDGIIVDVFGVEVVGESDIRDEAFVSTLRDTFRSVWTGQAVVAELIARHRRRWARIKPKAGMAPSHVVIDNTVSETNTVIDVFAIDRIGLLYDISRAISENGLDINMARIGTDGDRVADAFYVVTSSGEKLIDAAESEKVRESVLRVIGNERT